MARQYLIPRSSEASGFESFRTACLDLLKGLEARHGLSFGFAGRVTPNDHAEEWLFEDSRTQTALHLVRDWRQPPIDSAVCYAAFSGADDVIGPLADEARQSPVFHDQVSIAALAAQDYASQPNLILLMALACASSPPHPDADAVMPKALVHPDALVRYLAVFAIKQVGWPAYRDAVTSAITGDVDPNVRLLAKETVDYLGW